MEANFLFFDVISFNNYREEEIYLNGIKYLILI